ncbi:glycosyltransferase [Comamonas piscis]|uniref:Glycosyltransferase n=1 Tax=Comamonas piscis TaxID=1562974 RepID=A0A7G5EHL9_9BURK|nr:glycosyltransferase [Comamonas piscis]QMV73494.1 glycosyltransferase [Comamonas piscis]WSO31911.1 glycosyltransferase [Comamonas piscis]
MIAHSPRAIFTICSNNYLPMARVLLQSAGQQHPEADIYLCLADTLWDDPAFYAGDFQVITAEALGIPDFQEFAFRYGIMEFNTAVKPFMFQHLMALGYAQMVYLDPDIEVMAPLDHVFALLADGASLVLTPHLTQPAEREAFPDDVGIMRAGVFNLGFLAVGACPEAERIMAWWGGRLQYQCVNEPERGIFVDQKFMDLVPGFAADARILREPGYNLAYWNLHQRDLQMQGDGWTVDGTPLRFFHFSGIDPADLRQLSKYTTAFGPGAISPALAALMRRYARQVLANGHGRVPAASYAYARFASGTVIPEVVRRMFREGHRCWSGGDPFATYEAYLQLPSPLSPLCNKGYVTRLMAELHAREPWLQQSFDLRSAQGVAAYIDWFCLHARSQLGDSRLVEPVQLRAARVPVAAPPDRLPPPAAPGETQLTVVGYLQVASGVGEAGRQMLRTAMHAGFRSKGLAIQPPSLPVSVDEALVPWISDGQAARVQIFQVNADQLPTVIQDLADQLPKNSWRAVVPFWELEHFPDAWMPAFDLVDEVWAPTRYVQKMLAKRLNKPVLHMPPQLSFVPPPPAPRAQWGVPEQAFVFFFAFDLLSFVERKNPQALLRAFREAFPPQVAGTEVCLVIKTLNGHRAAAHSRSLLEALKHEPGVVLVDQLLSRAQSLQLMACCDAVVSLHRSEGLGLLVAEAMQLGLPVVATDYSATTELVSPQTGWPVACKLVPVPEGAYPYHQGQVWAEPDGVHAAWQMRQVYLNRAEAARRAQHARARLEAEFGADATAQRLRRRLAALLAGGERLGDAA